MTIPAATWVAAALAGLIHVMFFCMESLWWTKPAVYRRFHSTEAQAQTTRHLAFNQGFYNLFLAAGVFGGFFLMQTGHPAGVILVAWNCLSMLAASVVLAASSPRMMRGALIQGLPPLVFLLGTAYTRFG